MAMYGLPGCSRDSEFFENEVSTVSALTVCFCCLASETPVIDAITCTHTEFVQQYFTEWNNQKLAICYTCHFMLKKIEIFRRQVRESLDLLSDFQHTKAHNLNRPRLVNNLVTRDLDVTSNVRSPEPSNDDVEKDPGVVSVEMDADEGPGTSEGGGEDTAHNLNRPRLVNNLVTRGLDVTSNVRSPEPSNDDVEKDPGVVSVEMDADEGPGTSEGGGEDTAHNLNRPRLVNNLVTRDLDVTSNVRSPEPSNDDVEKHPGDVSVEMDADEGPGTSEGGGEDTAHNLNRPRLVNNLVTRDLDVTSNVRSPEPSNDDVEKDPGVVSVEMDADEGPGTSEGGGEDTGTDPTVKIEIASDLLVPIPVVLKKKKRKYKKRYYIPKNERKPKKLKVKILSKKKTKKIIKKKPVKPKKIKPPPKPPTKVIPTFKLAEELAKIRTQPRKSLKNLRQQYTASLQRKTQITDAAISSLKRVSLDKKCDGKIKAIYLTLDELMREREATRLKKTYIQSPYKCVTCIRGFAEQAQYRKHLYKCHPSNRIDYDTSCELCDIPIKTMASVSSHLTSHVLRYVCIACGRKSRELKILKTHYKMTHVERIKCLECDEIFGSRRDMVIHRRRYHKKICIFCKMTFSTLGSLTLHYREKHHNRFPFECDHCGKKFKIRQTMYLHLQLVHNIGVQRKNNNKIINETADNDQNIIVIENNEHDSEELRNYEPVSEEMENTGHSNVVEIVNNESAVYIMDTNDHEIEYIISEDCIGIVNDTQNIVEFVSNDHNIVELVNNEHNIVELVNNESNIVVIENIEHNIVEMENTEHNIVEMENTEHNIVGMENNEHNIVELVNNEHNIVELVNNESNIGVIENIEHNIVEMENTEHNIVGMENNEHNIVELVNNEHNIVELVNNESNIVVIENNEHDIVGMENNEHNIVELVNNEPNIGVIENNEHDIVGMENNEHNIVELVNNEHNIVELVNNESNIGVIENNEHDIVGMENNEHNIVELVNNEHNIVELANNEHNIVGMENNEQNIVEMENNEPNIVGMENTEHNIVELVNNEHNIVELVNNEHNIVKMENDEPNIVGMENIEDNIVGMENIEHNIVGMENNEHNIVELVKNEPNIVELVKNEHQDDAMGENCLNNMDLDIHNIVGMENTEHNIVGMVKNEPNIVELVKNEHQDDVMGENCLNNMDLDIDYNISEGKEDQNCILGL